MDLGWPGGEKRPSAARTRRGRFPDPMPATIGRQGLHPRESDRQEAVVLDVPCHAHCGLKGAPCHAAVRPAMSAQAPRHAGHAVAGCPPRHTRLRVCGSHGPAADGVTAARSFLHECFWSHVRRSERAASLARLQEKCASQRPPNDFACSVQRSAAQRFATVSFPLARARCMHLCWGSLARSSRAACAPFAQRSSVARAPIVPGGGFAQGARVNRLDRHGHQNGTHMYTGTAPRAGDQRLQEPR